MKTPLCEFCLHTRDLCGGCLHKLETGAISQADVEVSRVLEKFREKLALEQVILTRAEDCGNILFLFTQTSPGLLIGRGGKTISVLIKESGKHIRVVQETTDFHKLVEEVLHPVKPKSVSGVFHDGKETTKITVPRFLNHKLPTTPEKLGQMLEKVLKKTVKIVLE